MAKILPCPVQNIRTNGQTKTGVMDEWDLARFEFKIPDSKVHGAHLGPVGPRWAPCWPHESYYQGCVSDVCPILKKPGIFVIIDCTRGGHLTCCSIWWLLFRHGMCLPIHCGPNRSHIKSIELEIGTWWPLIAAMTSASASYNETPNLNTPLQWRHNGFDGVSNHQCLDCLLNWSGKDQRKHQSSA